LNLLQFFFDFLAGGIALLIYIVMQVSRLKNIHAVHCPGLLLWFYSLSNGSSHHCNSLPIQRIVFCPASNASDCIVI
jgi:hypothetical protein